MVVDITHEGKIMEDDHLTGVLTEKLIASLGFSPQRIVRMAILKRP